MIYLCFFKVVIATYINEKIYGLFSRKSVIAEFQTASHLTFKMDVIYVERHILVLCFFFIILQ